MEGTYEKPSTRKWRESLSSLLSPYLPGLTTNTMPPANSSENSTHLPVYSISASGVPSDSSITVVVMTTTQEPPPKSPTFSTMSSYSFDGPVCRICHDVKDVSGSKKLISPCGCSGSAQYIHKSCLQKWTRLKDATTCEICHQAYEKKYVKFRMTSSEENTVASAITILLLLLGVLSVGIYLLAEYLVKISRDPEMRGSGEIWVSVSLVIIGVLGMVVFLPWFIYFCARTGKTPRSMINANSGDGEGSSISDASLDSSTEGAAVEHAQMAYEQIHNASMSGAYETNAVDAGAQTTGQEDTSAYANETGAYVNPIVQVDGEEEDNIYTTDKPAVLFV